MAIIYNKFILPIRKHLNLFTVSEMDWKQLLMFLGSSGLLYKTLLPEINPINFPLWYIVLIVICYYILNTLAHIMLVKAFEKIFYWIFTLTKKLASFALGLVPIIIVFVLLRLVENKYGGTFSEFATSCDSQFIYTQYTRCQDMISNYTNAPQYSLMYIYNQTYSLYNTIPE